jgi:preprotein translocase subunit SecA
MKNEKWKIRGFVRNDDKVWFDEARKLENLCADVATARANGHSVLLLSHFESTLSNLSVALQGKGIAHERFASLNPAQLCGNQGMVSLGVARAFRVANQMRSANEGSALEVLVAEHHPLQSRDQEIVDAASKLACKTQLCFYFSLDDPLMKHFGAETIKALFEQLGVDKGECISHHLINTAIRAAQEKIESKVGKDVPTVSAADWFKYNLPVDK